MSKNKFKILIISMFCIIFSISNIYALDNTSLDVSGFADVMMQNGVADDIGSQLLEGGFFGENAFNFRAQDFIYDFSRNGHFYLVEGQGRWESDDPYNQGLYNMYVDIVNDLKNQPEMKYLFEKYGKYAGINNDEFSRAAIERITMEIMNRRIEEVVNAYKKGCNDKPAGKFTYNGKEYKCSEIAIQYLDYNEKMYSYEYLQIGTDSLAGIVDTFLIMWGGNVSDDFTEGIYENNQAVTGTNTKPDDSNNGNNSSSGGGNLFQYSIGQAFYFPRLTNAIGFANELSKAGEMESISGDDTNKGTIKTVIDDMITDFSKVGTYILYAALIFFGVRTIWAGVEGRVDFKESLPYILLAIVLFYLAPDVVSFISEIVDHEFGEEYLPNIWASFVSIVQVAAFGGILFTGVKLIFSNASSRADAKQNLIPLLIGCILVFASSTVVSVILNTAKDAGLTSNNKNVNNIYYEPTIDKV